MNGYQKKINKLTKIQVNKDIEEMFPNDGFSIYDIFNSSCSFSRSLYKVGKSFQLEIMKEKSYHKKIRKTIREQIKKEVII